MKKWTVLCAILLCVATLLGSCTGGKEKEPEVTASPESEQTRPPANPDAFELKNCTITRGRTADPMYFSSSQLMGVGIEHLTGRTPMMKDDLKKTNTEEILIGNTNREESKKAKAALPAARFTFLIQRFDNKIAIVGSTDEMTLMGAQYFTKEILPKYVSLDGKLNIPKDYYYVSESKSLTVASRSGSNYSVVITNPVSQTDLTGLMKHMTSVTDTIRGICGKKPGNSVDSKAADEERNSERKEILLGTSYYKETAEMVGKLSYNEYGVSVVGNKIVVFGYSQNDLAKAVTLFEDIVKRGKDGQNIVIPADLHVALYTSGIGLTIPSYPNPMQNNVELDGKAGMVFINDVDEAEYLNYTKVLEAAGLEKYAENQLGTCKFRTYVTKKITVNCTWDASNNTLRVVEDKNKKRPLREEDVKDIARICQPALTQVGLTYLKADTGMSYFMRLEDGRFIVFDGGASDFDDPKLLYDLLKSQCVNGEEPVIAAWFLTHAHGDHYICFLEFARMYQNRVKIQEMIYDFPTEFFQSNIQGGVAEAKRMLSQVIGVDVTYARTGQAYHFPGAKVEVLLTPEDFYPNRIRLANDSSVVYRVTCENQRILILGDSVYDSAPIMLRRYNAEGYPKDLQCDIMQMAHHGYDGVPELYQAINPETVLWPCPNQWFHQGQRWDLENRWLQNKWICESPKVKAIFNSGNGTTVLPLPFNPTGKNPPKTYKNGETIYAEDFEKMEELYETGWFYINSLKEDFQYTDLQITTRSNKDKGIYMMGNLNSVLCFARPELLETTDVFTLQLDVQVDDLGQLFEVCYNDDVMVDSRDRTCYRFTSKGTYTVALEVDRIKGTTRVSVNGIQMDEFSNASNKKGGIIFHSSYAKVFVGQVRLTAGTLADLK